MIQLRSLDPISPPASDCSEFLREAELDLTNCEKHLEALESRQIQLKLRQDDLRRDIAQIRSLRSPFRRMPTEIIQRIFELSSEGGEEGGNSFGVFGSWESTAFRISAVCYRWRVIALNTPDLWTDLAVQLHERARAPVEVFLARSKQKPLTLMLTEPGDEVRSGLQVLRSLVAHASRWRSVDYDEIYTLDAFRMLEEVSPLPALRSIVCSDPTAESSERARACTLLETLVIRYSHVRTVDPSFLPLKGIPNLVIEYGQDGAFTDSLEIVRTHADTIESLTYRSPLSCTLPAMVDEAMHTQIATGQEPIPCKKLYSLEVNLYHMDGVYVHLAEILQAFTLPVLKELHLLGDCAEHGVFKGQWPSRTFKDLLTRSRCGLTTLVLDGLPLSETELLDALQHIPLLEHLAIHEMSFTDVDEPVQLVQTVTKVLMKKLTAPLNAAEQGDISLFLPRLADLRLWVHKHFDADSEFVEMIRSRWYPRDTGTYTIRGTMRSSLEAAYLHIRRRYVDVLQYEPLKAFDHEGMKIVVKTTGQGLVV
ncbi:hypothetical protein V5O48_009124 [Marasmius crinis-equi]|uniref:F-box domain-containing protein n=1 Tax=Marasmius crinis-equi TaxID=585013 RepID=A0ABR3FC47_9AGAR